MSYVLLDDKFHSNGKTVEVGNAGAGLYARALSYCGDHLTDGFVPLGWAAEIATAKLRRGLLDAGLWVAVVPGDEFGYAHGDEEYMVAITRPGYFIPDFLSLNPTRESVTERREELSKKRSEAGKKGALKRWQRHSKRDSKAMATAKQTDGPLPLPLTSPKAVTELDQPPDAGSERTALGLIVNDSLEEAS